MNDLLEEKAMCWNNRLLKCMKAGKYTQASLAEALNIKYKTNYGQKAVNGWLNIGAYRKKGQVNFPKFDTMVLIADFFNVDIGYLTGETDEESFSLEKTCAYIGLSGATIKAITELTNPENKSSYIWKEKRQSLNTFLTAESFPFFFNCLNNLHHTYIYSKQNGRLFDNIDSEIDHIREMEFQSKIERYELKEALVILMNEIFSL